MKKYVVFLLWILSFAPVWAQTATQELEMPEERIYLHQNTTLVMSGEYLYYKLYCLNAETGLMSDLSKVAYVELVSEDGNAVISQKIRLENGLGEGDFFIPTSVTSGNYKLVAFTQWMRNGKVSDFFQNDVVVINPFQNDQSGLIASIADSVRAVNNQVPQADQASKTSSFQNSEDLVFNVSPQSSENREKVTMTLAEIPAGWHGAYSLSIRKIIDEVPLPDRGTAQEAAEGWKGKPNSLKVYSGADALLPELRGELIKGTVVRAETGEVVPNRKVALSIPSNNYLFKISSTGEDGTFFFNVDEPYANLQALIQVIGEDRDLFRIEMDEFESPDYSELAFNDFTLNESMETFILEQSIENQIQNAYAENRIDSIKKTEDFPPFFHTPSHEYNLDDYTRFPTIKETILEIIEQASTRQRKGKQYIHVRVYDDDVETGLNSLLLIDGLFIQDHNTVVQAKAYKIKKISVINQQYLYGSEVFEGIISMESYEGDFLESLPELKEQDTQLFRPELAKNYYQQDYRYPNRYKRIPDYRKQLLWDPEFDLDSNTKTLSFYTSDIKGSFEVVLEGFNKKGKPLSLRQVFEVR